MAPLWLTIVMLCGLASSCHPECTWQCDDPVCPAICAPLCMPPSCQVCDNRTGTPVCQPYGACQISCPPNQCESDACPACEVQCTNPCRYPTCFVQCEEAQCAWQCQKPSCPYPTCQLQCEAPACQAAIAGHVTTSLTLLSAIVITLSIA